MGVEFIERHEFANTVTQKLSATNIAQTVASLGPLGAAWDHLDILHRLEALPTVPLDKLDTYRDRLGIPALHGILISQALRYALTQTPPKPVVFHVNAGPNEGVDFVTDDDTIYITVIRTGYAGPVT